MTLFAAACAGIYPDPASRPALVVLLAVSVSQHDGHLAAVPQPAAVGFLRDPDLCDGLGAVLVSRPDARPGDDARPCAARARKQVFYGVLAMGFRGTSRAMAALPGDLWRHWRRIMAPLVCSVHSIVGLDFAGAATVGWHSTQFPPFFIFGAFLSGFATVLILIIPLRRLLRLERYITGRHLDVLCRLMLTSSLFVGYAYMMDAFNTFYGAETSRDRRCIRRSCSAITLRSSGPRSLFNIVLPQLLWFRARAHERRLPSC